MEILTKDEIILQKGRRSELYAKIGYFFLFISLLLAVAYYIYYFELYEFDFLPTTEIKFIQDLHIPVVEMYFIFAIVFILLIAGIFALIHNKVYNNNYIIVTNKRILIKNKKAKMVEYQIDEIVQVQENKNYLQVNLSTDEPPLEFKSILNQHCICLILNQIIEQKQNPDKNLEALKSFILEKSRII